MANSLGESTARLSNRTQAAVVVVVAYAVLLAIVFGRASHRQSTGALFVSDGFGYYLYLPSLVIDGDLDLRDQIAHHPDQIEHWTFAPVPGTNKPGNVFQIGPALLWSPFFLVAHGAVIMLGHIGVRLPHDGFGWGYELPVYCGSFAYGLLGVWYLWRLVGELWGELIATYAILLVVLASPVAAYLWFEPDMSHILSMTLIAMLFYYLQRVCCGATAGIGMWAWIGFLCGLIGLIRVPDLIVGLAVTGVGAMTSGDRKSPLPINWKKTMARGATVAIAAGLTFVPQLLVWKALYGRLFSMPPNPFYTQIDWRRPDLLNYFFSTYHGLFSWTPVLLIAVLGLIWGALRGPAIMRWSLLVFCAAAYVNSSIFKWWAGASFGERRMVDYAVIFALGLGYILQQRPSLLRNTYFRIAVLSLCGFNWILMFRYFTHDLPEYGFVSWFDLYLKTLAFPFRILTRS